MLAIGLMDADFDGDRRVDTADIAALAAAISTADPTPQFDLDDNDVVDFQDVEFLIDELLNTRIGDANIDGSVDFADFLQLAANFPGAGTWSTGDFNLDARVDFDDFLLLAENFGFDRTSYGITQQSLDGNRYLERWSRRVPQPSRRRFTD